MGKTLGEIVAQAGRPPEPPSRRRPRLAPELDAIVLKALTAEPTARYGSAGEMAADIEDFLAGRPVKARPVGAFSVAVKFVRRHRLAVGAAALALTLIVASAGIAIRQRIKAEQRFAQLRQLTTAVIFEFQDGISLLPGSLDIRRKMVSRSLEYLDSLATDARRDPQLLSELGKGYWRLARVQGKASVANLGDFSGALASIRKARGALQALVSLRPGDFNSACELGDVLFDVAEIQARVPNEDYRATRKFAIQYREDLARRYPDRDRAARGLATVLFYKPDYEKALAIYERLAQQNPANAGDVRNVALLCRMLAYTAGEAKDFTRMHTFAERAAETDRRRVAAQPRNRQARMELSFDLSTLATWHDQTGDHAGGIRAFEVLAIREDLVRLEPADEQARDRLLYVLCQLGRLYHRAGDETSSRRDYRRALEVGNSLFPNNSRPNPQYQELMAEARTNLR